MNWVEKVRYLIEREKNEQPGDSYFYDVNPKKVTWKPDEIDDWIRQYPWLPKSYIEFIKEFDGISVAFCRFYGSENGKAVPLKQEIDYCKPMLKDQYFPFGCYADGSQFIFDSSGKVYWWDKYDYDFEEEPKYLAGSLEEFIDQCVLGPRYGEFAFVEESKFYPFLKSMNWA